MRARRLATACILLGVLLLLGAVGLVGYNLNRQKEAGETSYAALDELSAIILEAPAREGAAPAAFPAVAAPEAETVYAQRPLTVANVDGRDYCGVITLPTLSIQLPVLNTWSYEGLRVAPCRYYGSPLQDNLVICAHNYSTHFGEIKSLKQNDPVQFTDVDGYTYDYVVSALEVVNPQATADVVSGEWDLTLFTCTIGGRTRVVVRCDRLEKSEG